MISLAVADSAGLRWAQERATYNHYLRRPVDSRCSVLSYLVLLDGERVGCLIFGRPQAQCCYDGLLTYGSREDVRIGRALFDRWEIVNLARVWLDSSIQAGGSAYVPNAASCAIGRALRRVVVDYPAQFPPCFLDEPWQLRMCLSYCDTRVPGHHGTIYKAAGFARARVNDDGIETWVRSLRRLGPRERQRISKLAGQNHRSRVYRSLRTVAADQLELAL